MLVCSIDPTWGGVGYTLRRYYVDEFYARTVSRLPEGKWVLDLGGVKIKKRGQFNLGNYPVHSVYLNISNVRRPHVQADASRVALASNTFDAVICAELLEHVPNPPAVLRETHRVLKSGGTLLATVPFLYRIHADPYDFGRYTDQYWQAVLQGTGFGEIAIERQGLFHSVIVDFLKQYLSEVGLWPFGRPAAWGIARIQRWVLEQEQNPAIREHPFLCSFTTGFGIIARKG